MRQLILYKKFIGIYLKSIMEYRFSFFMSIFLQIFTYSNTFLVMWILLRKFNNINGWSFYEIMFLYTFNLFSYALSGMFIKHPMLDMESMIRQGQFDSILTKPINPLFHVIARQFEYTFAGHIILCIFTFGISISKIQVNWSLNKILFFITFILGAILIHSAFMIITGSLSFFVVKSKVAVETTIYSLRSFLDYPLTIFNKFIQVGLTFLLPYAFVNYYPAEYFLGKTNPPIFNNSLIYMTPIVGAIMIIIALITWNCGIKNYKSTGS